MPSAHDVAATAARESYGRIVATLIRVTGDWDLAEDCAQEALALALERWPSSGVPDNPGGWLMTVARNRSTDVLRRAQNERRKLALLGADPVGAEADGEEEIVDDQLRLIFTCCHPALALEARVALTLRTVAGVPTADIARVFLVSESTMTRRLTRAKSKIAQAGIPYRVPTGAALTERLPGVLAVMYLLFTQGYNGTPAFADEAIRLVRLLRRLMPGQPEVAGLLALFLFQHSRREARRDASGVPVTLDRQDRALWDHAAIAEARDLLTSIPSTGPYVLQARIAAGHAGDESDWRSIAHWYDELAALQPTPVIRLNRAVAHGFAYGAATGLELLTEARADGTLDGYLPAVAAEAELTFRLGDRLRAELLFRQAADLAESPAERTALIHRAVEM